MSPPFDWWRRESHRGKPVVVKMKNPNFSVVELEGPAEEDLMAAAAGRPRKKNARQLTWVLLLRAHRAAGCLSSVGSTLVTLSNAARRRLADGKTDTDPEPDDDESDAESSDLETVNPSTVKMKSFHIYSCIKVFLFLSLILLSLEFSAYFKGWDLRPTNTHMILVKDIFNRFYSVWILVRVEYLAPPLQFLANVCIILFLIQSLDRLVLCLGCLWIRLKKIKPVAKQDAVADLESGEEGFFPMVLVQIPMCNEKEVGEG